MGTTKRVLPRRAAACYPASRRMQRVMLIVPRHEGENNHSDNNNNNNGSQQLWNKIGFFIASMVCFAIVSGISIAQVPSSWTYNKAFTITAVILAWLGPVAFCLNPSHHRQLIVALGLVVLFFMALVLF
mmetsp:Transcript_17921/g.38965  ORF Transcript_17921/g.38965 Transcript_17921/m.38965 type:complete len:129 (-) Transcript_17921:3020-3406(-)